MYKKMSKLSEIFPVVRIVLLIVQIKSFTVHVKKSLDTFTDKYKAEKIPILLISSSPTFIPRWWEILVFFFYSWQRSLSWLKAGTSNTTTSVYENLGLPDFTHLVKNCTNPIRGPRVLSSCSACWTTSMTPVQLWPVQPQKKIFSDYIENNHIAQYRQRPDPCCTS